VPKVLVLISHPQIAESRINNALKRALSSIPDVTIHHLDEVYKNRSIDVEFEQRLAEQHDVIVWQFPWYWYSTPALLKLWQDEVLTRGWAFDGGQALKGKKFQLAVSTGSSEDAYTTEGFHGVTMEQLLAPIATTANILGMSMLPPFITHGVRHLSDIELEELAHSFATSITRLTD
jgi:glutathione-regulated potassium-efflux system ancillary protein KefG